VIGGGPGGGVGGGGGAAAGGCAGAVARLTGGAVARGTGALVGVAVGVGDGEGVSVGVAVGNDVGGGETVAATAWLEAGCSRNSDHPPYVRATTAVRRTAAHVTSLVLRRRTGVGSPPIAVIQHYGRTQPRARHASPLRGRRAEAVADYGCRPRSRRFPGPARQVVSARGEAEIQAPAEASRSGGGRLSRPATGCATPCPGSGAQGGAHPRRLVAEALNRRAIGPALLDRAGGADRRQRLASPAATRA
jgi:hypothetical protein